MRGAVRDARARQGYGCRQRIPLVHIGVHAYYPGSGRQPIYLLPIPQRRYPQLAGKRPPHGARGMEGKGSRYTPRNPSLAVSQTPKCGFVSGGQFSIMIQMFHRSKGVYRARQHQQVQLQLRWVRRPRMARDLPSVDTGRELFAFAKDLITCADRLNRPADNGLLRRRGGAAGLRVQRPAVRRIAGAAGGGRLAGEPQPPRRGRVWPDQWACSHLPGTAAGPSEQAPAVYAQDLDEQGDRGLVALKRIDRRKTLADLAPGRSR